MIEFECFPMFTGKDKDGNLPSLNEITDRLLLENSIVIKLTDKTDEIFQELVQHIPPHIPTPEFMLVIVQYKTKFEA